MPCKAAEASVEWITSDGALADRAHDWGRVVGLDTEFVRTDTFFPLPGLYQLASGEEVFLLDPLAIDDWTPLLELLEDPSVVTVLHACSEDLELMRHHFGAVPRGLFDTQLANAFLSPHYSVSFTRLVEERLQVTLQQHETRSNWRARPLTSEQIRYAWEDVYYLPPLYEVLRRELEARDRLVWFREEMDLRGRFELNDPQTYYQGVSKAWRLPGAARARLQALCAWRESQAMTEDRPRNRLVRDEHLLVLAEKNDIHPEDVEALLPAKIARRYMDALLAAHAEGRDSHQPVPAIQPLTRAQTQLVSELRDIGRARAEALGLAPELLSRKREVEACVRSYAASGELPEAFQGWRMDVLGEGFRQRLEAAR
jgi:ribonuclease D